MADFDHAIARIQEKLRQARSCDPELQVFGASGHRYALNPPATQEAVRHFEAQHAIELPAAYRAFLLRVGNGGPGFNQSAAGPFYGIYPLGAALDGIPADAPEAALAQPCVVSPRMSKQDWSSLTSRLGLDADLPDEAHDAAICALFGGLLPIGTQGCTYGHCLVLNGPFAGRVANVDTSHNHPPVFTHEPDFIAWYERWLDEVISGDLRQNPSWFAYVKGGTEAQLLAGLLPANGDPLEQQESLDGLAYKRRLSPATLRELVKLYADREAHRPALCRIVCKSNYELARPLLSDLAGRDPLAFLQCLHWHARDHVADWEPLILRCGEEGLGDNEEAFRFFTYVLEPLRRVDRGANLASYTRHAQPAIRAQALYALGKLEPADKQRFLACFIDGLNDDETQVIRSALQGLDGVRDPSLLTHYQRLAQRFPVERDYILSNLERRLAELRMSPGLIK
jgi:hypothetical protein